MEDRLCSAPGVAGEGEDADLPYGEEDELDETVEEKDDEVDGLGRPTPMPPYRVGAAPSPPTEDEPEALLSDRPPALRGAGEDDADELRLSGRSPLGPDAGGGEARVRARRAARLGGDGEALGGDRAGGDAELAGGGAYDLIGVGGKVGVGFGTGVRSSSVWASAKGAKVGSSSV